MKIIGWIRAGDATACGGTVVEGVANFMSHGQPLAFQGARIACGSSCVIADGVQNTSLPNGCHMVIHGMRTSGGCPIYSTLNDRHGVGNESGDAVPEKFKLGPDGEWIPIYAPLKHGDCDYDQHIILEDQNGNPLAGIPYRLVDAQGAIIAGVTGIDGKTKIIAGHYGDTLDCTIAKEMGE